MIKYGFFHLSCARFKPSKESTEEKLKHRNLLCEKIKTALTLAENKCIHVGPHCP